MLRLAVLRFGDEWSVQSQSSRTGHFNGPDSALKAGARMARQAAFEGHEVELLLQDPFGLLEAVPPARQMACLDARARELLALTGSLSRA